jgi:iron complex transport system substrate-binding protein
MKEKLQDLSALAASKRVRVLFVVQREPLRVAGRDTFVNEMIELAGGENAIGPTLHKYPPIGAEQVIACAADVIIEPTMTAEDVIKQRQKAIQYWSRFKNVPAVKNSRIYVIDGDAVSRLGPRICEGTKAIAKCLRPEFFAE